MSSFPKIVAYIFLTLQCLTPCLSSDEIQEARELETYEYEKEWEVNLLYTETMNRCAAAWIGEKHLISAASCFGGDELNLKSMMDTYFKVVILPMSKGYGGYGTAGIEVRGRAVVHPLYKTKYGRLPIAYDVALIRVDSRMKEVIVADLCSEYKSFERHIWTVVGRRIDKVRGDGPAHGYKLDEFYKNVSFYLGLEFVIDPSKQFTMHLKNPHKSKTTEQKKDIIKTGAPVFVENPEEPKKRCIAGIVSFVGFKDLSRKTERVEGNKKTVKTSTTDIITDRYITATKVVDLLDWIKHTKKVLDDRSKITKLGVRFKPTQNGNNEFQRQWWKIEDKKQQMELNITRAGSILVDF